MSLNQSQNQRLKQRELTQDSQGYFRELQRGQGNTKQREEHNVHGLQLQREPNLVDLHSPGTRSTGAAKRVKNQGVQDYEVQEAMSKASQVNKMESTCVDGYKKYGFWLVKD